MPITVQILPLSDAYYFLNLVRSTPNTRSAAEQIGRSIRVCILLSWVALEAVVNDQLIRLHKASLIDKLPGRLGDKLKLLMTNHQVPFDMRLFAKYRQIRNRISHTDDSMVYANPSMSDAQETFDYCLGFIHVFYPKDMLRF